MVLVLHGAVIALALFSRNIVPAGTKSGVIAFDIPAGARPPHPQPPHRVHPAAVPVPTAPAPVLEIVRADVMQTLADALPISDASAQELPAAIGGGCDLTRQVQDALRHSDEIIRRLPAIPAARRSIANAIVVWNAGWIDPGPGPTQAPGPSPAQAALAAIRQAIEQSVAASSEDCRNQLQAGPRLMYLPDSAGKTTVLALGSGQWRWQQLIGGPVPPVADTGRLAMATLPLPQRAALSSATSVATSPAPVLGDGPLGRTPALNALLASLTAKRLPGAAPYYP